jgi:hypothetical protein
MNRNERFIYNEETEAIEAYEDYAGVLPGEGVITSYQITLDRIKGLRSGDGATNSVEGWMNHLAEKTLRFDGKAIASFISAVMDAGLLRFAPPKPPVDRE